jgi:methylenetetrahydrofolate reductase (NADPH)
VELLSSSSIELSTNGRQTIMNAAEILSADTPVYVPRLPKQTLEQKRVQIKTLREFGLEPVPHIAARQMQSERELHEFLDEVVSQAGVNRVLVIGGDNTTADGPFQDSAAVIKSGILKDAGIRRIDVAGYPEGHPRIPFDVLSRDLDAKIKLADEQSLGLSVVTQFSFTPPKIIKFCSEMMLRAPGVPVYAGLAGPTSTAKLLRFAQICGVSTSLRAMKSLGMNAVKLARHSNPDKQFAAMAQHKAAGEAGSLAGIHLFSFGGFVESAQWLSQVAQGSER